MAQPNTRQFRNGSINTDEISFREKLTALRYLVPFFKLVWNTNRKFTSVMIVLRFLRGSLPLASLWIAKLIIDTIVAGLRTSPDYSQLWTLVGLEVAIALTSEVLARASSLVESLLGDQFANYTSVRLMEHAATLDLYQFEDPAFYDQLERARRQTAGRVGLLADIVMLAQETVTLISLTVALTLYSPWLLAVLVLAILPSFLGETHFASLEYSLFYKWTPERRQLDYLRYVAASDETAKEVQVFDLSQWLLNRFRYLADCFYLENKKLAVRKAITSTLFAVIATAGYYGAFVMILLNAVKGQITIGALTFLVASFARSRDLIQRLLLSATNIHYRSLYLKDLFDFFEIKPSIQSAPGAPAVSQPIQSLVFEDVGFRYPGSDQWAVRHIYFNLNPGERLAFVGENGAGKTTLAKLLARLYDPTEGRILLNGRDLREYDLTSTRRAIGVIFQDYVRYDFPFDENIGVGEIDHVRSYFDLMDQSNLKLKSKDHPALKLEDKVNGNVPASIVSAAEKSLASTLLGRLPAGYRQMLGRRFDTGVDLSGGEWQKIALARAYMRDSQVLILDEPTASLDARAEFEVFKRFSQLVAGRMAVIISHRFSTVRMADRILVLNNGMIVENGTHEELIARKGLYAELFSLQAEGYR